MAINNSGQIYYLPGNYIDNSLTIRRLLNQHHPFDFIKAARL
jgi:hypothetical protein